MQTKKWVSGLVVDVNLPNLWHNYTDSCISMECEIEQASSISSA